MGTGKFITVYPGIWTEREKPYAEEYFAKIKELEDRGPIDVQALISGKIEKGTQGFSNVLEVKEDMMVYNAKKYDPDNKLYTDDEYAKSLGFDGKIAMPAFAAHDDSFLTAFNGKARDFLAVTGLHHEIEQLLPVYAGDTAFQTRLFRLSAACIILFLCAFFNREKRVWIVFFHSDLSVSLSSADDDKFSSINC